jgi:hypothetical protein
MTTQPGGNGPATYPLPAQRDDLSTLDPIGRGMASTGEPADLAFLLAVARWAGVQQFRHDSITSLPSTMPLVEAAEQGIHNTQ